MMMMVPEEVSAPLCFWVSGRVDEVAGVLPGEEAEAQSKQLLFIGAPWSHHAELQQFFTNTSGLLRLLPARLDTGMMNRQRDHNSEERGPHSSKILVLPESGFPGNMNGPGGHSSFRADLVVASVSALRAAGVSSSERRPFLDSLRKQGRTGKRMQGGVGCVSSPVLSIDLAAESGGGSTGWSRLCPEGSNSRKGAGQAAVDAELSFFQQSSDVPYVPYCVGFRSSGVS